MSTVGNTPQFGVYTLGSYGRNYKNILDLTYPVSQRDVTTDDGFVTDDLEIGAIIVNGNNIFISWYDHGTTEYGVDKVDYTLKLSGAYVTTTLLTVERERLATFVKFIVAYAEMPAGCSIAISYSVDYGVTWIATTGIQDTMRQLVTAEHSPEGSTVMVKIVATTSGGTAPTVEAIAVEAY